jgi:uncharacterized protein
MKYLASCAPLLISYSGGLDSSLLCYLAYHAGGEKPLCVLVRSPLVPGEAVSAAIRRAEELGYGCEVTWIPLLDNPRFRDNPKDRCYICKKTTAQALVEMASKRGYAGVADGVNTSDLAEFRPGLAACEEEGILHPFVECGISKDDIRAIARQFGLSFWNEPSGTCLATRIPYGDEINPHTLEKIESAENCLRRLDFSPVRVRVIHGTAVIEVMPGDLSRLISQKDMINQRFRELGFPRILVDLEGYRSGSMDEPRHKKTG